MSVVLNGTQLRCGYINAAECLEEKKEILNKLNLFPVADRDTGVNMCRSLRKVADYLAEESEASSETETSPAEVAEMAYMQLLEHALGNSGTILTLFFEGFSAGIPADAPTLTGLQLANAFLKGAENTMENVPDPVNGTILSVALQSAKAGVSIAEIKNDAAAVLHRIVDEAYAALMQTANQNPVLRPYKVADSGAYGFCLILEGFLKAVSDNDISESKPLPILPDIDALTCTADSADSAGSAGSQLQNQQLQDQQLQYRYCTEFVLVPFENADMDKLASILEPMGDHFLHVSNSQFFKVHIHTNEPDEVFRKSSAYGTLRSKKVDDMLAQLQ